MSQNNRDLRIERFKSAMNSVVSRFCLTTVITLILVFLSKKSLDSEPNAFKWIMITIWVDVSAYFFGFLGGYKSGVFGLYSALTDSENSDIIGGKGDRHEE